MTKFENDMLALPDPLKEMVDPLKEIASTVKKLTFGQMVQYVKEIKSISDVLTEQAMWDWACKKVGGGFDVKAEQENGQANSD
jgi:hypothetical protein